MKARWGGSCGSAELAAPALQHAADAPGSTLHFWIVGNENLNEKQKIMLWPLGKKKDSGSCSGYPTVNNRYSTSLDARSRTSKGASCVPSYICAVWFGCSARTFCLHLFIRLPSSTPHGFVFWISPSLMVQDDLIHPGCRDSCVRHPKN